MDRLVRCPECDVAFTSPRVIDAVIGASYADAVDPVFVAQDELRISTFRRNFRRIIADVGVAADRSKKILDVGCAGGAFVRAAQDLGFTSTGIEPSRWLAERARTQNGLDVRPGILSDHSFPGKSFTFISLWDVIEHLTNPGAVLDDIHRLLADDGFLIVNWPDYGSLVRKVLGRKWPFFLNVHLFYFTPSSMRALLRNHGFEPVSIRPYFQTLEFGYALDRAVRIFPFFSPLVRLAKRLGVSRFPLRYNAGQSLMVARKKSR